MEVFKFYGEPVVIADGKNKICWLNQAAADLLPEKQQSGSLWKLLPRDEFESDEGVVGVVKIQGRERQVSCYPMNGCRVVTVMREVEGNGPLWSPNKADAIDRKIAQLRSELSNISAASGMLSSIVTDPACQNYRAMMERARYKSISLMNHLQLIQGSGAPDHDFLREQCSITEICENCVKTAAERTGRELLFIRNVEYASMRAVPERIITLAANLLRLGIKSTKDNQRVDLIVDKDDDYIVIRMEHNGEKLPAKELTELFTFNKPMELTADAGDVSETLAIVRTIAEAYKGTVTVEPDGEYGGFAVTVRLYARTDLIVLQSPRDVNMDLIENVILTEMADVLPLLCYVNPRKKGYSSVS